MRLDVKVPIGCVRCLWLAHWGATVICFCHVPSSASKHVFISLLGIICNLIYQIRVPPVEGLCNGALHIGLVMDLTV